MLGLRNYNSPDLKRRMRAITTRAVGNGNEPPGQRNTASGHGECLATTGVAQRLATTIATMPGLANVNATATNRSNMATRELARIDIRGSDEREQGDGAVEQADEADEPRLRHRAGSEGSQLILIVRRTSYGVGDGLTAYGMLATATTNGRSRPPTLATDAATDAGYRPLPGPTGQRSSADECLHTNAATDADHG